MDKRVYTECTGGREMTKYNIGDYVEVDMRRNRNEEHGIIDSIVVENGYSIANIVLVSQLGNARAIIHDDEDEYYGSYDSPDEIIRKLQPSEIIFNFGSGIRGTIHNHLGNQEYWFGMKWEDFEYILPIEPLTEPMKSRVLEVLKAQETNAEMANALLMDTLEERIDYLMSLIMHRDKDIAKLQADNRSLVEQMNKMALEMGGKQ